MIEYVYAVKDDLSGKYTLYGLHVNKAVAIRDFQEHANKPGAFTTDYMLYECGTFDHDTGVLDPYVTPVFITRGEKKD